MTHESHFIRAVQDKAASHSKPRVWYHASLTCAI